MGLLEVLDRFGISLHSNYFRIQIPQCSFSWPDHWFAHTFCSNILLHQRLGCSLIKGRNPTAVVVLVQPNCKTAEQMELFLGRIAALSLGVLLSEASDEGLVKRGSLSVFGMPKVLG